MISLEDNKNDKISTEMSEKEALLDFLKKYSDVDLNFIKEFIEIQEADYTHAPFNIDIELVAKWLKSKKGKLKETLLSSYTENIDFISLSVNGKQSTHGGQNKQLVLLSPDTFKMLCMKSHTVDAEKIRYYYITLEKLVYIFKDEIIANQKKRINELESNMKKIKYPIKGAIYVIAIDKSEYGYKIGKTIDMNKRYDLYKNAHKDNPKVKFVFYSDDIDKLEKCIKNLLLDEQYRHRKEFYIVELEHIILAVKDCDVLITNFKCKMCKKNKKTKELKRHIELKHNSDEMVKFYMVKKYT